MATRDQILRTPPKGEGLAGRIRTRNAIPGGGGTAAPSFVEFLDISDLTSWTINNAVTITPTANGQLAEDTSTETAASLTDEDAIPEDLTMMVEVVCMKGTDTQPIITVIDALDTFTFFGMGFNQETGAVSDLDDHGSVTSEDLGDRFRFRFFIDFEWTPASGLNVELRIANPAPWGFGGFQTGGLEVVSVKLYAVQ